MFDFGAWSTLTSSVGLPSETFGFWEGIDFDTDSDCDPDLDWDRFICIQRSVDMVANGAFPNGERVFQPAVFTK